MLVREYGARSSRRVSTPQTLRSRGNKRERVAQSLVLQRLCGFSPVCSNARSFICGQENAVDGENTIGDGRRAQGAGVIMYTGPGPVFGAFDQPCGDRVEVNIFDLLIVFFNGPQSPVEESGLPEKARLFSPGIDRKGGSKP